MSVVVPLSDGGSRCSRQAPGLAQVDVANLSLNIGSSQLYRLDDDLLGRRASVAR
ncbi:hypothetical protein [Streptomyces sp. NPDC001978]|uniref:hypothetical protein n=1 Tax=Streptomyces sp. NPDC001978 TaxID=3364627 RepID=UPI00368D3A9A